MFHYLHIVGSFISVNFSRPFQIKWAALAGMIFYGAFLGLAGIMGNLEDDQVRLGNIKQSRRFRWGRYAAMLFSIIPFIYMYAHFAYQVNYHVNVNIGIPGTGLQVN